MCGRCITFVNNKMVNLKKSDIKYLLCGLVAGFGFSLVFIKFDSSSHSLSSSINLDLKNVRFASVFSEPIKILCWVLTNPKNHKTRSLSIKNTWGKRCTTLLFVSSEEDPELPTIAFKLEEGKQFNWGKIKAGFKYVFENHFNDANWFFKVDDDAYVVFENLQHMLRDKDPNEPVWFGSLFTSFVKTGWHSGGPGYVLSKEAVRRFVQDGIANKSVCRSDNGGGNNKDDVEIGRCLEKVGVHPGDSRDEFGRHRFIPLFLEEHLIEGKVTEKHWFWRWNPYPQREAFDMVSEKAVSFHYTKPEEMYILEYLIYHLRLIKTA